MSSPVPKRAKVFRQASLREFLESVEFDQKDPKEGTYEKETTVVSDTPPHSPHEILPSDHEVTSAGSFQENSTAMAESLDGLMEDIEDDPTLGNDPSCSEAGQINGFGTPLHEINFGPSTYPVLPPLVEGIDHCVTVHNHFPKGAPPRPFPDQFRDVWDSNHVRMPCSKKCLYPVEGSVSKQLKPKWELISLSLSKPIQNSQQLEAGILGYNSRQKGKWNFDSLHGFFAKIDGDRSAHIFGTVLPRMIDLALSLPNVVTHAIPLLCKQADYTLTMSQKQASCLLANAFFCTFPNRNSYKRMAEFSTYPSINFNALFSKPFTARKVGKLKCIFHYFDRVTSKVPTGTISFHRQVLSSVPLWEECEDTFSKLHVTSSKMIEDIGSGMLQVDFANRFIGGGVLGNGCVQEEIRFMVCPELIVSRLFTEALDDNECMIVTGCEQYSYYNGYGDTFKWSGDYLDETVRDEWGRRLVQLVAIDAVAFRGNNEIQFTPELRRRELQKAYCGFHSTCPGTSGSFAAVATGNWGCGAFGGDVQLKSLLQIMAAAKAKRDVIYTTFGNSKLAQDLVEVHGILMDNKVTIAQLWNIIAKFSKDKRESLFIYIKDWFKVNISSQSSSLSQTLEY